MTNDEIFDIFSEGHGALVRSSADAAMNQARLAERFTMCHEIQDACMKGSLDDRCEDVVKLLLKSKESG